MLDFKEIAERVPVDAAMKLLNLDMELVYNGSQYRGKCPACDKEGGRSLTVTPAKGLFGCWNSRKRGDSISLTAHVRGWQLKEAAQFLADSYKEPPVEKTPAKTEAPKINGFNITEYLKKLDTERGEELGFDKATCEDAGMGYCSKGVHQGRFVITLRKADGTFIECISISEKPKRPKERK